MGNNQFPSTGLLPYTVKDYIEFAFRDCGLLAEQQTPQYVDAARKCLYHILQDLSNKNVLLFQLRYIVLGSRAGQRQLTLPYGTIDIREANYRYPINPTPTAVLPSDNPLAANAFNRSLYSTPATATSLENWFGAYYTSALRVLHVGINAYAPTGSVTYSPILEGSNDGSTWNTVATLTTYTLSDYEWQYYQIDGAPSYAYWRVRQSTSAGILAVRQIIFGNVQQDIPLFRLNRDDYSNLPNKDFQSNRALQYWYDKQITPIMNLWPVPQDDYQMFQVLLEAQMPDIGLLGTPIPIPDRWVNYVQTALSHKLSLQLPNVDLNRHQILMQMAQEAYKSAQSGEEDTSASNLMPGIGVYNK